MSNEIPSKDPASDESMGGMLASVIKKYMQRVDGMLPATVISYDRVTNIATVQPSIDMTTTSGATVRRAAIAAIPVLAIGGGGFCVTFPLQAGDTGWIEASDRDISLWMQATGARPTQANTQRMHSFSDGRFIPDVLKKYTVPSGRSGDMVIQSLDGSVYVALSSNTIRVKAPTVLINADAEARITAPLVRIDATTLQLNAANTTGTNAGGTYAINAATITFNGIVWGTHKHTGVQIGGSSTGGPTS